MDNDLINYSGESQEYDNDQKSESEENNKIFLKKNFEKSFKILQNSPNERYLKVSF